MRENKFSESIIIEKRLIRVLVACETEEDAAELLEILVKNGYSWASGAKINPCDNCWGIYKQRTFYAIDFCKKSLLYGNIGGRYEKVFDKSSKFVYQSVQNFDEPSKDDVLSFLEV